MSFLRGRNLEPPTTTTTGNLAPALQAPPQLALLARPTRPHEVCAPAIARGVIEDETGVLNAMAGHIMTYCDGAFGEVQQVPTLAQIPHAERALVMAKGRFVERVFIVVEQRGLSREMAVDWIRLYEGGTYAPLQAASLTWSNFRNWYERLPKRRGGLPDMRHLNALARRYNTGPRQRYGDPNWWNIALRYLLGLGETKASVAYRKAVDLYRNTYPLIRDGDIPSERQWTYFVREHVPVAVAELERRGLSAFVAEFMGFVHRKWDMYAPNEIWEGDGHVMDFVCQYQAPDGSIIGIRPTLGALRDLRSGLMLSYRLCPGSQNHLVILTSLIDGMVASGWRPPRLMVTDWGSDYLKQGLFEPLVMCGREYSVGQALGITHKKTRTYNGREKTIERNFRDLCEFLSRGMPGYCGNSPDAKTPELDAIIKQPERLPTLEEAHDELVAKLQRYHERGSRARITTDGRPPIEAYQPRGHQLRPDEVCSALLWPTKAVQVGRGLTVTCAHPFIDRPGSESEVRRHRQYTSRELAPFYGRQVPIAVVPYTDEMVVAYHPDYGTPLCVCRRPLAAAAFDADPELLGTISRENNFFLGWTRAHGETLRGAITDPALRAQWEAQLGLKPANARLRLSTAKQEQLAAGEEARAELAVDRIEARRIAPAPPTEQPVDDEIADALTAVTYGTTTTTQPEDDAADLDMAAFDALDAIERPQDDSSTPDFEF